MITYTGTVLLFDGQVDAQGDIFDENTGVELPSREVDVLYDFHNKPEFLLGKAKLFFRPGKMCYEMKLNNDRLPKHALDTLFPAIGGKIVEREGKNLTYVIVNSIGLCSSKNANTKIRPIGEQNEPQGH